MTIQTIKDFVSDITPVVISLTLGSLIGFGVIGIVNNIPETIPTVTCQIK